MPAWIHNRAEHILAKNPSMDKSQAFAIATQQSHRLGKSPKGYGTSAGKKRAKAKFDKPKKEYVKTPNPGKLESPKMASLEEKLAKVLTMKGRVRIKEKNFAIPSGKGPGGTGKYPIHDAQHAKSALTFVRRHGTPEEKSQVYAAVAKKYPGLAGRSSVEGVREAISKRASAHKYASMCGELIEITLAKQADAIPGGKADTKTDSDFNPKQIAMGEKVELEHTNKPSLAREISRDHLTEFSDYYTRLKKMESEAEKAKESG
jgi:hypothetical protein